jgi:hypothetical protein
MLRIPSRRCQVGCARLRSNISGDSLEPNVHMFKGLG